MQQDTSLCFKNQSEEIIFYCPIALPLPMIDTFLAFILLSMTNTPLSLQLDILILGWTYTRVHSQSWNLLKTWGVGLYLKVESYSRQYGISMGRLHNTTAWSRVALSEVWEFWTPFLQDGPQNFAIRKSTIRSNSMQIVPFHPLCMQQCLGLLDLNISH